MPSSVNKQIIPQIYDSDLVIANLTKINSNVMYKLALRHRFNKLALIIAEDGTDSPFVINNEHTIFYINDAQSILDLKKKLLKAIDEIRTKPECKSPVVSVLGKIKFEEQVFERKNGSNEDIFLDSLQIIVTRIDRIEHDTKNNINKHITPEIYLEKGTYRIYIPQNYDRNFENILAQFVEFCKNRNIQIRGHYIEETFIK